jgi:hypothetical protein
MTNLESPEAPSALEAGTRAGRYSIPHWPDRLKQLQRRAALTCALPRATK